MPLTRIGEKVKSYYKKKYGSEGESNFYASIKKGIPGSVSWHKTSGKNKYSGDLKG